MNKYFIFSDKKEEVNFFVNPPTDFSLIEYFPSLGWLMMLQHQQIAEIFEKFTAKELAIAWTGPEEFLNSLRNNLPWEKRDQMEIYCQQVKNSRDNIIFKELMVCAGEKLRTLQKNVS